MTKLYLVKREGQMYSKPKSIIKWKIKSSANEAKRETNEAAFI